MRIPCLLVCHFMEPQDKAQDKVADAGMPSPSVVALGRCCAVVGDVWSGPMFCGFRAAATDANGRPCCKRHLGKYEGTEWFGDRRRYPEGTGGNWKWRHGEFR